jgi:hypothetical protein
VRKWKTKTRFAKKKRIIGALYLTLREMERLAGERERQPRLWVVGMGANFSVCLAVETNEKVQLVLDVLVVPLMGVQINKRDLPMELTAARPWGTLHLYLATFELDLLLLLLHPLSCRSL